MPENTDKSKKSVIAVIAYIIIGIFVLITVALVAHIRPDIPVEKLKEEYANDYSSFVEIDGMDVHYRDEGEGDPLILIHGWASSLHTWDGWTEELKDDFRIIRLDLPAFGLTGPSPEQVHNVDFYVDFIHKFIEELDIEKAYMAGNSLGGRITWSYASQYPEKINKIILIDAAGYPMERPDVISFSNPEIIRFFARYITPKYIIRMMIKDVYGDKDKLTDETVERYYRLLRRADNRSALFRVLDDRDIVESDSIEESLSKITAPALIMWGESDMWIPLEHAYRFESDIAGAKLITYEGVGHVPMEEIPEETSADARSFLIPEQ